MWSAGVLLYSLLTGRNPSERAGDVVLGAKRRLRTQLQRTQRASYVMPTAISPACQDLLSKLLTAGEGPPPALGAISEAVGGALWGPVLGRNTHKSCSRARPCPCLTLCCTLPPCPQTPADG